MESKLYQDFTFAEYKEGFKKKNIWIGDDGCRALENYYIRNEKEAAGTPDELTALWEDAGTYDDAAEAYGFDIYNHSRDEIVDFVENKLGAENGVKVAYYRGGDTVLISK